MESPDEKVAAMFQRTLHVDFELAEALEECGITSLEEVAYVPLSELLEVPGLTEETAVPLRNLARMYLLNDASDGLNGFEGGGD